MRITIFRDLIVIASISLLAGVGLSACGQSTDTADDQARSDSMTSDISDSAMTAQVKVRLSTASGLEDSNINVSTSAGVVTLEGTASDRNAISTAEQEAQSIEGVRRVLNNLVVSANGLSADNAQRVVSDSWITSKVKASLMADNFSEGFDVSVDTRDGIVTLKGVVKDLESIDHVKNVAMRVEGVSSVDTSGLTHNGIE